MKQRWTDVFVHMCAYTWRSEVNISHLPQSLSTFLCVGGTRSFIESGVLLSWTKQQVPGIFLSHLSSSTWCAPPPHALLYACWGSELKSLWLHRKHFADWTISPPPWDLPPEGMNPSYRVLPLWLNHHRPGPQSSLCDASMLALRFQHIPLYPTLRPQTVCPPSVKNTAS